MNGRMTPSAKFRPVLNFSKCSYVMASAQSVHTVCIKRLHNQQACRRPAFQAVGQGCRVNVIVSFFILHSLGIVQDLFL